MASHSPLRVEQLERKVKILQEENEDLVRTSRLGVSKQWQSPGRLPPSPRTPLGGLTNSRSRYVPPMMTPMDGLKSIARSPLPSSAERLEQRCRKLDAELNSLDAENEALEDQIGSLKATIRRQERRILELEEAQCVASEQTTKALTENDRLKSQMEKILDGIALSEEWRSMGTTTPCMCDVKDEQILELRRQLTASVEAGRDAKQNTEDLQQAAESLKYQLDLQRQARLKSDGAVEDARCSLRVLQIEAEGLRNQCQAAESKMFGMTSQATVAQKHIQQLELAILSMPGGAAKLAHLK
mmetsp:Transcript_36458/g.95476  ORF Transcript_36458/g.95476 Transcript_36458/m.95476 type:complete len:299 (-) Transcript_36458:96-992(-)|eukprot:CAMPEP_0182916326 /NCGR_PEP_ID=MMETSP0105_2-20130417/870_1 /TAXON_ID=81532 ORGANISM="Acanthoeca-like sp., Strain 10tr" /NCGR_SAMPLE_ID=MMETSP0105_2 /ASSEMBLY_ACC=CAM_ASM_000205 /LENGTH=298 /DNA_ID=CAMNT_0025053267 /DNA_START=72 /DNA_END=968 /DNA_ORIENTATION=+